MDMWLCDSILALTLQLFSFQLHRGIRMQRSRTKGTSKDEFFAAAEEVQPAAVDDGELPHSCHRVYFYFLYYKVLQSIIYKVEKWIG